MHSEAGGLAIRKGIIFAASTKWSAAPHKTPSERPQRTNEDRLLLHLPQLVAVTVPINTPSRRAMEKLGMTHRPELSFDHPRVPPNNPYQHHVLYS